MNSYPKKSDLLKITLYPSTIAIAMDIAKKNKFGKFQTKGVKQDKYTNGPRVVKFIAAIRTRQSI